MSNAELIKQIEDENKKIESHIQQLNASVRKMKNRIESAKSSKKRKMELHKNNKKRIAHLRRPYRVLIYMEGHEKDLPLSYNTHEEMIRKFDEIDGRTDSDKKILQLMAYKYVDNKKVPGIGHVEKMNTLINTDYVKECKKENIQNHLRINSVFFYGLSGLAKNVRELPHGIERFIAFITSDESDYLKNCGQVTDIYQVAKLFLDYHNLPLATNKRLKHDFVDMVKLLDENLGQREKMLSKGIFLNYYSVVRVKDTLRFREL